MARQRNDSGGLVYATDRGRLCPGCGQAVAACTCRSAGAPGAVDGIVRLHRETNGRGGKTVTVVRGLPLDQAALQELAKALKQKCGVGGAVKAGCIEIQGDQRAVIKAELEKKGFAVKLAGG